MKGKICAYLLLIFAISFQGSASVIVPVPANGTPDSASVKSAVAELKGLSKAERKNRIKLAKEEIRAFKKAKKAGKDTDTNTLLLVILAILLPPLAVYLHQGEINTKFWISLLLTLLFWLPGVVYALIVILGNE